MLWCTVYDKAQNKGARLGGQEVQTSGNLPVGYIAQLHL